MSIEAPVTFSNPHNHSGVSQRDRIAPSANTVEAYGGHALKLKKKNNRTKTEHDSIHARVVSTRLGGPIFLETATLTACFQPKYPLWPFSLELLHVTCHEYVEFW